MAAVSSSSSSLLQFSHVNPHVLSHTVRFSLRPNFSPPKAAPPDFSGDSSPAPSSEKTTNSRSPSAVDELNYNSQNKKKKRRKDVIRKDPIQIGVRTPQQEEEKGKEETSANEGAFLLAWLGLGALIFVEGLALAASGFLPEEWDKFLVKFLYPSFTPTVFLFLGLSVGYGVIKYFEAEKMNKN